MTFHEITDAQWARVQVILTDTRSVKRAKKSASADKRGRPPIGDRKVLNGILYVLVTGSAWNKIPEEYGKATTCWRRFKKWSEEGTWARIWRELLATYDDEAKQVWVNALLNGYFHPCKLGDRPLKLVDEPTSEQESGKQPSKK